MGNEGNREAFAFSVRFRKTPEQKLGFFESMLKCICCIVNGVSRAYILASKDVSFSVDRQTPPQGAW